MIVESLLLFLLGRGPGRTARLGPVALIVVLALLACAVALCGMTLGLWPAGDPQLFGPFRWLSESRSMA